MPSFIIPHVIYIHIVRAGAKTLVELDSLKVSRLISTPHLKEKDNIQDFQIY